MSDPTPLAPVAVPPLPAEEIARQIQLIIGGILVQVSLFARAFGILALPLHHRINRAGQRLARLLLRIAAGRIPPAPRPRDPATPARPGGPPAIRFSRRRAWIIHHTGHHTAAHASQLQYLLHDPATLATLQAIPPHALASAARTLRPLCRLLGIPLPEILQPPPRPPAPPKPPRPARPKPEKPPPLRSPLYPRRRARDMPLLLPHAKFGPI